MSADPFKGRVVSNMPLELGEGPTYDPETGTAWWFNITGKQLIEWHMESDALRVHALPEMASVLAMVDGDTQMIVTESGLHLRDIKTGALARSLDIEADNPATRSNDGRVHPCGALWFGTMGKGAEARAGTIYHVFKGAVTPLFPGIGIPNAICFSPDGTIAYFADTQTDRLMRVSIDPLTALPAGEPVLLLDHSAEEGGLDGAVVDAEGRIWSACWGGGRIDVYTSEARHLKSYAVPAGQTSCPAFVGAKADRLLVTSAAQGLDEAARAKDRMAGFTFLLDIAVKGRFEPKMAI